jgi:hypothetical protein
MSKEDVDLEYKRQSADYQKMFKWFYYTFILLAT